MYTRSYFQDDENLSIPENYDGNAFRGDSTDIQEEIKETQIQKNPFEPPYRESDEPCVASKDREDKKRDTGPISISALLQKFQPSSLFGKFDFLKDGRFDIGSEEILIIGVAIFLFFSEGRDIECALMLLFLLLIK